MLDASTSSVVQLASLTRSDITALFDLAQHMVVDGVWIAADRARNPLCDCVDVTTHDVAGPAMSIGVLASGSYFYMDHRSSAVRIGRDLEDVLEQAGLSAAKRASA